ncbi:MAG: Fic family protein [Actinomycetota bacterium]
MSSTRAGRYEPQPGGYRAFVPAALPPAGLSIDSKLQALLSRADQAIGRLDAVSQVPDPHLFVQMYIRREAVLSSQIEGTQASLMDVLEFEAEGDRATLREDVLEIENYIVAMHHGLIRLRDLPVSRRLLCDVHAVLMEGVRGGDRDKTPGRFRKSQNWIGGVSPASARFVPPPWEEVGPAFADLENFLHDPAPMPPLLKVGIAHAQFETIHPFLDGNGRIGRLLITFWLISEGVLRQPLLYPSLFFKEHREEYGARLQAVRDTGDWEAWLAFFLDGIGSVAEEAAVRAREILALRDEHRRLIVESAGKRAPNALLLLDVLFHMPVVDAREVQGELQVSQPTASALVNDLERLGILTEVTGKKRNRLFAYEAYINLFPGAASKN